MKRVLAMVGTVLVAGCASGGPSDSSRQVPLPPVSADASGDCPFAYAIKAGVHEGRQVYVVDTDPGPADRTLVLPPDPSRTAPPTFEQFDGDRCFSSSVEARDAGFTSLDPLAG